MYPLDKKELIIGTAFWFIVILLVCSLLSACTKTTPVTETVADSAKTTISTIVKNKPECKDVGDACNAQIDAVKVTCEQEIKLEKNNSWKRGLKQGGGFTAIGLVLLWLVIKRLFK